MLTVMVMKDLTGPPGCYKLQTLSRVLPLPDPHAGLDLRLWWHPGAVSPSRQEAQWPGRKREVTHLSRQLRGHLRGQAVGQGSGGRGHMLLKAVDARLFGGLGAG